MTLSIEFMKIIEIFLKLVIASLCGSLLFFDRNHPLKSFFSQILVFISLGMCLLVLLWQQLGLAQSYGLPVIFFSSLIVALGIFTSGILLFHRGSAQSIILSAAIWIAGGIGIAIGYSLYYTAIIASLIGYIFLRLTNKKASSQ
jgi:putative Mg2+ transporter-C (MgtC) family protein